MSADNEDSSASGPDSANSAGASENWHRVASADDLPEDGVIAVQAGATEIALVRSGGRLAALAGRCPHMGGPLGKGTLENGVLICPWHGWGFDPFTGEDPEGAHTPAATFEVGTRDDGIYVKDTEVAAAASTVSDIMVQTMVNWGVTHVFGMVGFSILGMADAVRRQAGQGKMTYIGIRHEGAAAFACSGYAKLTGRPAACMTIAGPGATNLLTGLWDAKTDRAPVLALTGQVKVQVLGPGVFQEINLSAAFESVAGFSQHVMRDSSHAELMSLALKHAVVEREVAHLIFPDEVQLIDSPAGVEASGPTGRLGRTEISPPPVDVVQACLNIAAARRPIIIAGYGARGAMADVTVLAERLNAPVLTTFKAKGQLPDSHPLAAGVLGMSGTPVASWCMNRSDLIIVFGSSFSENTGIDPHKPIIQVDFDRSMLAKFHAVSQPVWGDVGASARALLDGLPPQLAADDQRQELAERRRLWRGEKMRLAAEDRGRGVSSAAVFAALQNAAPDDAIFSVDVGDNTYSFGRYLESKGSQVTLMSGNLGSIGFGFPAAMGAWAARPERPVIAVVGDGGFGQYLAEFTTAVKYGMNIKVIVLDNGELGMISKEQQGSGWPEVWQTSLQNPDFSEYARICGGFGVRVEAAERLDEALSVALEHQGPAIIDVVNDPELI